MKTSRDPEIELAAALVAYRRDGIARGYHLDLTAEQVRASQVARARFITAVHGFLDARPANDHPPRVHAWTELSNELKRLLEDPASIPGNFQAFASIRNKLAVLQGMPRIEAERGKEKQ